jgi:acetoin utilization protein AcuB
MSPPPVVVVGDLMSSPVATVDLHATLWRVWELLVLSGLRHLVVLDGNRCVGVLSDRDILMHVPLTVEWLHGHRVHTLVRGPFVGVTPETPVPVAARAMHRGGSDAAPVMTTDGELVGVLTASDLVAHLGRQEVPTERAGWQGMMVSPGRGGKSA